MVYLHFQAIRAKDPPLRVAGTRLEKRAHRPDIEDCNDPPHVKLVEEVGTINNNLDLLTQKLAVARETREDLIKNKANLKKDIDVKNNTLKIDKQKCMEIRQLFL